MTLPPALIVFGEELKEYSGILDTGMEAFPHSTSWVISTKRKKTFMGKNWFYLPGLSQALSQTPSHLKFIMIKQERFSWLRNLWLKAVDWLAMNTDKWNLTGIPIQGAWLQSSCFSASARIIHKCLETQSSPGSQHHCKSKEHNISFSMLGNSWLGWMEGKFLNDS